MHGVDISPLPVMPVILELVPFAFDVGAVAVRAMASAVARAPSITATRSPMVAAVTATSAADAYVPFSIGGSNAGFVNAVRAQATANAYVPTVAGSAMVAAVIATATSTALAASTPVNGGSVVAPKAGSTSTALASTIAGEAVLTGGGPGTSSAVAIVPAVSGVVVPAPAFASVGTATTIVSSGATSVPVPAGVAAGDIILVTLTVQDNSGAGTVTPPAGFTQATSSPVVVSGAEMQFVFWKRASGSDTGTYDFTHGVFFRQGVAHRYTGCIGSGNPLDATNSAAADVPVGGVTPAVSLTTTGSNRLLVFSTDNYDTTQTCTPPSGFTERFESGAIEVATNVQAVAGSTGSVTATWTANVSMSAWLGALKAS